MAIKSNTTATRSLFAGLVAAVRASTARISIASMALLGLSVFALAVWLAVRFGHDDGVVADGRWLMQGPRQDRYIRAAGAGLIGTLLLIVAGLGPARWVAIRTRRIIEAAGGVNGRLAAIIRASLDKSTSATRDTEPSRDIFPPASNASHSNIPCEETPPIEVDALLERCMGDVDIVRSILGEFETQAVAEREQIQRCAASGDCKELTRVAHSLKGASGVLSANVLSGIAAKLELMGRSGVLAEEGQLLTQLNDEVQRLIAYLPKARTAIANGAKA
jgi:HPt (histidine-containing phosphotransfer) domain-containing protein